MAYISQPPRLQLGDAALGTPTDQVTLVWETRGTADSDVYTVEYRTPGGAWTQVTGERVNVTGVVDRVIHEVDIFGLNYDSTYEYRVVHTSASAPSQTFGATFDTRLAAGDTTAFTFAAYGDAADPSHPGDFFQVQNAINASTSEFALLLGDNAYTSGTHAQFDTRFAAGVASPGVLGWMASNIDYASTGNHENLSGGAGYRDNYATPQPDNLPAGTRRETTYSFDYGMVHFATFDSDVLGNPTQLAANIEWLRADLAASTAR